MFGNGFFHGYNTIVCVMILNHALSGIAVSLVMKYADNIVKVIPKPPWPSSLNRHPSILNPGIQTLNPNP